MNSSTDKKVRHSLLQLFTFYFKVQFMLKIIRNEYYYGIYLCFVLIDLSEILVARGAYKSNNGPAIGLNEAWCVDHLSTPRKTNMTVAWMHAGPTAQLLLQEYKSKKPSCYTLPSELSCSFCYFILHRAPVLHIQHLSGFALYIVFPLRTTTQKKVKKVLHTWEEHNAARERWLLLSWIFFLYRT